MATLIEKLKEMGVDVSNEKEMYKQTTFHPYEKNKTLPVLHALFYMDFLCSLDDLEQHLPHMYDVADDRGITVAHLIALERPELIDQSWYQLTDNNGNTVESFIERNEVFTLEYLMGNLNSAIVWQNIRLKDPDRAEMETRFYLVSLRMMLVQMYYDKKEVVAVGFFWYNFRKWFPEVLEKYPTIFHVYEYAQTHKKLPDLPDEFLCCINPEGKVMVELIKKAIPSISIPARLKAKAEEIKLGFEMFTNILTGKG
jgi:hypothetical protein